MAERVLTLRELNRATLARQLLRQRKRLSPTAVLERLVGMQAQWPSAPYVGIWTRTTSFRREALERELASAVVVKATVMQQTLHLVTRPDYALLRAALSETNFPDQTSVARSLAPSVRALAATGPVTTAEALAYLEREHGLVGFNAVRAWRGARVRAHLLHHHESALWRRDPPTLPRRVRARVAPRHRRLEHDARAGDHPRSRAARAAGPVPRRARPRAPRCSARAATGRRHSRARPLPAEIGQRAARVRGSDARASGALPEDGHPHERRRRADVPRRRVRRGIWRVEKGRVELEPFSTLSRSVRKELEDEAGRLEAFLAA